MRTPPDLEGVLALVLVFLNVNMVATCMQHMLSLKNIARA